MRRCCRSGKSLRSEFNKLKKKKGKEKGDDIYVGRVVWVNTKFLGMCLLYKYHHMLSNLQNYHSLEYFF